MKPRLQLLKLKVWISLRSIGWLLRRPKYVALSFFVALFFFEFVYWMLNLSTLGLLLVSPSLPLLDKLALFTSPFQSLGGQNGIGVLSMMLMLSVLQGVSVAALVFIVRHQPKVDGRLLGGSTAAGLLAIIGLGCPACGTSLLTPIVALFVTGSAASVAESITAIALPVALVAGTYSIYATGVHVANTKARLGV